MSGCGKYFKEQSDRIRNVGVDPIGQRLPRALQRPGRCRVPHIYKVEGIGEDMICGAMDLKVMDDVRQVDDRQCFSMARRLAREEGIFAGGSSGGAVHVAAQVAKEMGRGQDDRRGPARRRALLHLEVLLRRVDARQRLPRADEPHGRDGRGTCSGPARATWSRRAPPTRSAAVVARLRESNVSQLPVVDAAGLPVGMVHETDLLRALVDGRRRANEPVASARDAPRGRGRPRHAAGALQGDPRRPTTSPSSSTGRRPSASSPRST